MRDAAREWLVRAGEDLIAVERLASDERLTNIAAFHAQQCVEKSLKAILEEFGQTVPRTHDLVRLRELAKGWVELGCEESIFFELCTVYIESRSPSDLGITPQGKPTTADANGYLEAADEIYATVKKLLSGTG